MTRTHGRLVVLATLVVGLLIFASAASAVTLTPKSSPLAGSNFQGGDGNQDDPGADVSNPPDGVTDIDWQSADAISSPDPGAQDSAFVGGNKESEPGNWDFTSEAGGVNPNKDNLLAAWTQSAPSVSGIPNTFLNLAFTREAQTGNTFITFELNQSPLTWNNGNVDIACRTTGDLLISYEVASGGSPPNVDVTVYSWTADTSDDVTGCSKTGHFDALDPQGDAEAAINKDAITNYLPDAGTDSFAAGTFGEASLNLTGVLTKANLNPCESFGQVSMHTRSSTSIDSQLQDYISPVPLIVRSCGIKVVKSGDPIKHDGDPETFGYDVTNTGTQPVSLDKVTGVVDDTCAPVVYDGGDSNDDGFLDLDETWSFHCDYVVNHADENANHEIVNTVTASGAVGDTPVSDTDTWTTLVIHPQIDVEKTGPDHAYVGDTIAFDIAVSNTGDTDLLGVSLTDVIQGADHGCDSISGPTGDENDDGVLATTEVWHYTCTYTVRAADEDATHHVVNVATVGASDALGEQVSAHDDAAVLIVHPAIAIDKSGPATAQAGDKVAYTLTVTNPGDEAFAASTVTVTDERCNGDAVTLLGNGGDLTPDTLDPGDVWAYTCSVQTALADTAVHNTACVTGTDQFGTNVSACDDADTTLSAPAQLVLPERVTPGRAQLLGPSGCQAKTFSARVRGSNVASVVFVLDGNVVRRLHKPNSKGLYVLRVNPKRLSIGVHRLVANIVFEPKTGTRPKSLRLSFQRCGRKQIIAPRFTG